jgi:hypothetical protein
VRLTHWRGPLKRAALAAVVAALTPLPLFAAGQTGATPPMPRTLKAAVQTAAVRNAAVIAAPAPRTKAARKADQGSTSKQSTGFFRTAPGAVALAVMVLGTGYAVYSASHDRIHSPAKQ